MFRNFSSFFVKKKDKDSKEKPSNFENLVVIVILGVIILIAASFYPNLMTPKMP